jgi:hypothetical protein
MVVNGHSGSRKHSPQEMLEADTSLLLKNIFVSLQHVLAFAQSAARRD